MNQDHAFSLVRTFGDKVQGPVECGVSTADDHQVFVGKVSRVLDAVKQLAVVKLVQAIDAQQLGLKSPHARSDENRLGQELRALGGFHKEAAVFALFHHADFLAQMKGRAEGLDLLHQVVGQFLAGAGRNRRNVVDRLVGVQLNRLAARVGQRIDDVRLDLQQAEFKHLKQADRACAHDDGIGFDGAVVLGCGVDHFLVQLRFHDFLT